MHPIVHFEINGSDGKALCSFYEQAFGWHIQWMDDMSYGLVDTHGGKGINGGIGTSRDGQPGVVLYVAVPDLEATLASIETAGGKTVSPPVEIPDVVTFAIFEDPHGNTVGIVKDDGSQESPGVSAGDGVPVTWFEIMGKDASLQGFYAEVFGWKIADDAPTPGYGTVGWEQPSLGGGVGAIEGVPAYTTIYPEVADVDATCKRIVELGGAVMMEPTDMAGANVRVAVFHDPQGNMVGVYKQIGAA